MKMVIKQLRECCYAVQRCNATNDSELTTDGWDLNISFERKEEKDVLIEEEPK